MVRTPGFVLPSSFPTKEALTQDLQRRAEESGFVPFDPSVFLDEVAHEDSQESEPMTTEVDNYLEHYGVKGMKWGKRTGGSDSSSGSDGKKSRKELRALDRANRKSEKAAARKKWDDDIDSARDRLEGDANKYNQARAEYKSNKQTIGKVAAKKIVKEHEEQFVNTWNQANLYKTKEAHAQLFATAGGMLLSAAILGVSAAASNR
jgi:hypothetical protein